MLSGPAISFWRDVDRCTRAAAEPEQIRQLSWDADEYATILVERHLKITDFLWQLLQAAFEGVSYSQICRSGVNFRELFKSDHKAVHGCSNRFAMPDQ